MEKALYRAVVVRYEQNAAFNLTNESNKMPKKLFVLYPFYHDLILMF